jgi:hypothetical protein
VPCAGYGLTESVVACQVMAGSSWIPAGQDALDRRLEPTLTICHESCGNVVVTYRSVETFVEGLHLYPANPHSRLGAVVRAVLALMSGRC